MRRGTEAGVRSMPDGRKSITQNQASPVPSKAQGVQQAWADHAADLAAWAKKRLVNRTDAHGQYFPLEQRSPEKGNGRTRHEELTEAVLARHFRGAEVSDLVGLHTTSADNHSRWLALDVDQHGDRDPDLQ